MPARYASTKQRGFIHAKAAEGVAWAKKAAKEADAAPQPKNTRAKRRVKKRHLG